VPFQRNVLAHVPERPFEEVKRRTGVVGTFPNETSARTLATEILPRSRKEWALKRYLALNAPEAVRGPDVEPEVASYSMAAQKACIIARCGERSRNASEVGKPQGAARAAL
jgi:hypothetical protein